MLYVIRNTTTGHPHNNHNIRILRMAIEAFCKQQVQVVVINSEDQRYGFDKPVINLDPYTRNKNHFTFDVCRVFTNNQRKPAYFKSRTIRGLRQQVSEIPSGEYILVDDDIASGSTVGYVSSFLSKFGINIIDKISLMHEYCKRNNIAGDIFDVLDTHDFWGDSGLVVGGKRQKYQSKYVDLKTRASFSTNNSAKKFLNMNLIL